MSPGWAASFMRSPASLRRARASSRSCLSFWRPSAVTSTGWLREHQVHRLLVGGLATDYCVRASVLDARQEGFEVMVLEDGVGAVDVKPGDGERALAEMREAGASTVRSGELG